jgi:glucokinase
MAFPIPAATTRIDYARLGGNAGFIGAAGCARQRFGPPQT